VPKWVPGQSGNVQGRPPRKTIEDELKFQLARFRGRDRKVIVQELLKRAKSGTSWALKLVAEVDLLRVKAGNEAAASRVDELTPEQRLARLTEILANPEVRSSLENLLRKVDSAEVVQGRRVFQPLRHAASQFGCRVTDAAHS
jgi:hypothetical protein